MPEPLLTVLGLAVLDDIHFSDGTIVKDVLGGSGAFCTIGARLFSRGADSKSISWLIRTGDDFPSRAADEIASWNVNSVLRELPGFPSSRGQVVYQDSTFGSRTFQYTTPVNGVLPEHLAAHPSLLAARYFHVMCHATHVGSRVEALLDRRRSLAQAERPCMVWEGSTATYFPEHLQTCFEAVKSVDVYSPNHVELLALFELAENQFGKELVEELAWQFLAAGIGPTGEGVIVVRAAEHGCLIMSRSTPPVWLPAFYQPGAANVVDTTGAGNAFLGGFIVGHSETADFVKAAHYGSVAASFLVEQIGVPKRDGSCSPTEPESWNGKDPFNRLAAYQQRLKKRDPRVLSEAYTNH